MLNKEEVKKAYEAAIKEAHHAIKEGKDFYDAYGQFRSLQTAVCYVEKALGIATALNDQELIQEAHDLSYAFIRERDAAECRVFTRKS